MKRVQTASQSILWVLSVLASRVYLGVFFGLAMWAVLPMVIQWQSTVVISGSMEPGVSTGDIVVAQTYTQDEIENGAIKIGDVTLAHSPDKADTLVTHRVVEILPNGDFITKGDANQNKDSTPVPRANVIGVERLLVPYVGIPLQTLRAGDPLPTLIFVILTFLAQMIVWKDNRNDRAFAKAKEAAEKGVDPSEKKDSKKSPAKVAAVICGVIAATALVTALVPAANPVGYSQAAFSASVPNNVSTFTADADWTVPTTSMVPPVSPLKGTVSITANAADEKSGIKNTVIQYQIIGASTWTNLCTVTVAPYSCSWNTATVADGNYDLRSVATDNAGFTATSATVRTTIANNMLVVLNSPGEAVKGTVVLGTNLYNTGTVNYTVRVEYVATGSTNWRTICTGLTTPYNCSWNTTTFTAGEYDLRAVAVSGGTTFTSQIVNAVMVDNVAPTVSMIDPTTPISGSWNFAANVSDGHSGVAQVTLQYSFNGSAYIDFCTFTTTPYSCRIDTRSFVNGPYSFRAIADDVAGNRAISAVLTNKVIDNTVSSVSMENPGDYLAGNVQLKALANSTAGVSSVVIQIAPNGTTSWTTLCTFGSEPFTCMWNSASIANGSYSFRAILTDSKGVVTTSTIMAARLVDNLPLRGFDIQSANGTATVGKVDAGDTMNFTYNTQVNLATVTAGWNGAALPVTVRVQDGGLVGLASGTDMLDIQRTNGTVNLGSVDLRQDYVKNQKTVTYNATMVATTVTVNGVPATKISVTLGSLASGAANTLRVVSGATNMIWTPSALVKDLNGLSSSTAPVTESGIMDRDF